MGDTDVQQLQEMASRLGAMLNTEGKRERQAWLKLRGKLANFATLATIAGPKTTAKALASKAKEAIGCLDLGHPDAEDLLRQMMVTFGRIGAEKADGSKAILLKDLIVLVADKLSMIPLCDSGFKPMIKGTEFVEDNVEDMVFDWLSSPSVSYGVVSIVGAQSSGKSFLLNELFGSNFPVMDKKEGWGQTTQGILMSRCISPSWLILDVEGFDGRERGEDKKFENQAALFALTVSDLMMVNISEQDIGRMDGGGKTLFETIFQERTKLPPGLTKMIVVIRRCDEETTSKVLNNVTENMKKMWTSVHQNTKESTSKFEDYIEVEVFALVDKNVLGFQTQVTQLRKLISTSTLDHNKRAKVPASSFMYSSKRLWDQIKENKKLDLPSIKVAFTILYCQQIGKEALSSSFFHKELLEATKSPRDFKILSDTLLDRSLAKYDQETIAYDEELRKDEHDNLIGQIKKIHSKYSRKLIQVMREKTFDEFKSKVAIKLQKMEETGDENYDVQIVEDSKVEFIKLCEDLKVFGAEYFHNICAELETELDSYTNYMMLELKVKREKNRAAAAEKSEKEKEELLKRLEEINLLREKQENERKKATEEVECIYQMIKDMHEQQKERDAAKMARHGVSALQGLTNLVMLLSQCATM